jgi:hypothetical protein
MAADFSPTVGTQVSKEDAQRWIDRYDKERRISPDDTKSVFYGREVLDEILKTPGNSGISFFLAYKFNEETGKDQVQLVLVPTTEEGKLLWVGSDKQGDGGSNTWDVGTGCPPRCPTE